MITACFISNYLVTRHIVFYVTPFGIKDGNQEGINIIINLSKLESDRLPFNPIAEGVTEGSVLPKDWLGADYYKKLGPSGFWRYQSEKLIFHFEGEISEISFEEISAALQR